MESFSHPFYDIEIDPVIDAECETYLVKILSIDGRRFTYELHSSLTEEAIEYIKSVIDAAVFGDVVILHTTDGWEIRESSARLRKHS